MLDFFRGLLNFIPGDRVDIDDFVFKLHYKATAGLLFAFSLIVTAHIYVGKPIDCIVEGIRLTAFETYCLTQGTFTIYQNIPKNSTIQTGFVHGLTESTVHSYYIWVPIVFFIKAVCFLIPRNIWKYFEGGRMDNLVSSMDQPILAENERKLWKEARVNYFCLHHKRLDYYAYKYIFCEILNLGNVLIQMYFMNYFLGGVFMTYGRDVLCFLSTIDENRVDPMALIFPKLTKCTFHRYGPSGTITQTDGLCMLAINAINEKMIFALWFWYFSLAIVSALNLVLRVPILLSKYVRTWFFQDLVYKPHHTAAKELVYASNIGDWFVLYQLGSNIKHHIFPDLVMDIHKKLIRSD